MYIKVILHCQFSYVVSLTLMALKACLSGYYFEIEIFVLGFATELFARFCVTELFVIRDIYSRFRE